MTDKNTHKHFVLDIYIKAIHVDDDDVVIDSSYLKHDDLPSTVVNQIRQVVIDQQKKKEEY